MAESFLPTDAEVDAYIASRAPSYGILSTAAINVSRRERGNRSGGWIGDNSSSFGPFQLHLGGIASGANAGPGLGDEFVRLTGLNPRDIAGTWRQQVDFALWKASQVGWEPFKAAKALGYGIWEGIRTAASGAVQGGLRYFFPLVGYSGNPKSTYHTPGATDLFAPEGTDVRAVGSGTVVTVGRDGPGGNSLLIRGVDGLEYYYAHFRDALTFSVGDNVQAGQKIGKVGKTGNAANTEPHLHLGIGYGIQSGTGATGGTGRNFDAQTFLAEILSAGGASATTEGVLRGVAGAISGLDISSAVNSGLGSTFDRGVQAVQNFVADRAAAIVLLSIGVLMILGAALAFAFENPTVRNIIKTAGNTVGGPYGKAASIAL